MKRQTKIKPADPVFQVSFTGNDVMGIDTMIVVRGNDLVELKSNAIAARTHFPLTPRYAKAAPRQDAPTLPAETQVELGLKCPKCGSTLFDNRVRKGPADRSPLLKCPNTADCGFLVWPNPRTPKEVADKALWEKSEAGK